MITDRSAIRPGVRLQATVKGQAWRARIGQNKDVVVMSHHLNEVRYKSLSAAAAAIRGCATNGWTFWSLEGEIKINRRIKVIENPRTLVEWEAYIQAKGLRMLGKGVSRKVYALDENRVIKITYRNDFHEDACGKETAAWQCASDEQRQYLAAVLDSGKDWLIMERAKKVLESFGNETSTIITQDLHETTGFRDLHSKNIGYFGAGRFKCIDYAV